MQEQRFAQITDKLANKGYNLYPFNEQKLYYSACCSDIILATQESTMHREYYFLFLTHRDLDFAFISAIRQEKNFGSLLFEIDQYYLAYHYREDLDPLEIDQTIAQLEEYSAAPDLMKTQRRLFAFSRERQTRKIGKGSNPLWRRVRYIGESLAPRGYRMLPFDKEQEVKHALYHSAFWATHEISGHQVCYLVAVSHFILSPKMLQAIQDYCRQHPIFHIYEVDKEFLIFHHNADLNLEMIDSLLRPFSLDNEGGQADPVSVASLPLILGKTQALPIQQRPMQKTKELPVIRRTSRLQTAVRSRQQNDRYETRALPIVARNTRETKAMPAIHRSNSDAVSGSQAKNDSLIGVELEGYRLLHKIGVGGFGFVYLAKKSGQFAVVKIEKNAAAQQTITDEFHAITVLNDLLAASEYQKVPRCIPRLHGGGYYNGRAYFIEEFIVPLDLIRRLIYSNEKVKKIDVLRLLNEHYQEKSRNTSGYDKEKYLDKVAMVDSIFGSRKQPAPIDPLIASHLVYQLAFLIYIMNINNYHYGDLKSENIGLRLQNMDILDSEALQTHSNWHYAIDSNLLAEQLLIKPGASPSFCAVLIDFGSFSRFSREGESTVFFTPKYMVPNEILVKADAVRKSFVKDPYSLGLVFLNMVSGLSPFWNIKLSGNIDKKMEIIKGLYEAKEQPFDFELLGKIVAANLDDINRQDQGMPSLGEYVFQHASALMSGTFREGLAPLIAKMQKILPGYHHAAKNRYNVLKKGPRVSEHDQLMLDMKQRGVLPGGNLGTGI